MDSLLQRFKPGVGKRVLLLVSGLLWIGVGLMLCTLAGVWLSARGDALAGGLGAAGALAGLAVHHFGLLKIVDRNLARIRPMEGRPCVFAFQPWRSYFLIALMAGMGIGLRHSPLPKHYLAVLYLAMGVALVLSSLRYLRVFLMYKDLFG